jgi:hypothetical protein
LTLLAAHAPLALVLVAALALFTLALLAALISLLRIVWHTSNLLENVCDSTPLNPNKSKSNASSLYPKVRYVCSHARKAHRH